MQDYQTRWLALLAKQVELQERQAELQEAQLMVDQARLETEQCKLAALNRIAGAVEELADAQKLQASRAARYTRKIKEYAEFDWASIEAQVLLRDRDKMVSVVRWQGNEYTRRNKNNDIWFSRKIGQRPDPRSGGMVPTYDTLIVFRAQGGTPKSIAEEVQELIGA